MQTSQRSVVCSAPPIGATFFRGTATDSLSVAAAGPTYVVDYLLADPAALATHHVANQHHGGQRGEDHQEDVLDLADVIAPQHQQQEDDDEDPGDVPGAVVDPAPAPLDRRHFGGVDVGVALHFGADHGGSCHEG